MKERQRFSKMLFLTFTIMVVMEIPTVVYGCLCSISHPQQKFCRAELVMTGRMENMEWLPIPQLIPTEEPWLQTTIDQEYRAGGDVDLQRNVDRNFSTDVPDTEIDGSNSLQLEPSQFQQSDDPLVRPRGNHEGNPKGGKSKTRPNEYGMREVAMMEPRNYNVIYEIEVDSIFKDSKKLQLEKGAMVRILAPPPQRSFPMCSYSALRRKRLYLFVIQNTDMMTGCDWVEEYRGLSRSQKQGIKSAYGRSCDTCQINITQGGMWQNIPDFNDNATCMADMMPVMVTFPDYMGSDCYARYSHCTVRKGRCKWYSSKDFKKCKLSMKEKGRSSEET